MVGDSYEEAEALDPVQLGSGTANKGVYYLVHSGVVVDPSVEGGRYTPLPSGRYVHAQGDRVQQYLAGKFLVATPPGEAPAPLAAAAPVDHETPHRADAPASDPPSSAEATTKQAKR